MFHLIVHKKRLTTESIYALGVRSTGSKAYPLQRPLCTEVTHRKYTKKAVLNPNIPRLLRGSLFQCYPAAETRQFTREAHRLAVAQVLVRRQDIPAEQAEVSQPSPRPQPV